MYKEGLASDGANKKAMFLIKQTITKKVAVLKNPNTADTDFFSNLHDLCMLNRMRDSHNK